MKTRESGADLLRCIALLCVISYHFFLNCGYHYEAQTGTAMWLAGSARALSICCIGLFCMLTGYLRCNSTGLRDGLRALPPVLVGYVLAAVISIPIRHFFFGDVQTLSVWLSRLFSFSAVYYGWYVEMFLGLALLLPFLNRLLQTLSPRALLGFAGVLLILTALPGATPLPLAPDYWRRLYPVTYCVLGAAVRRLQPTLSPWVGLSCAAALALGLGGAAVLSTDGVLSEAFTQEFGDLWIVCMVLCIFISLYRVSVSGAAARMLAFCAGGCYGAYLLSHLLDAWCYRLLPQWKTPAHYWKLYLAVALPIFAVSIPAGKLLQQLTGALLHARSRITGSTSQNPS